MAVPRGDKWEEDIERRLKVLEQLTRKPLSGSGMTITAPGQFEIDGTVTVTGDFIAQGKIDNDALVNPVRPEHIYASGSGFGITTTSTNKLTWNLTVPVGFTSAAITVTARVRVVNPNSAGGYDGAGGEYLSAAANIAGFNGYAFPLAISGSNGSGTNISTFSAVLGGYTAGNTIAVQAEAFTTFNTIAASANNIAELSGMVLWFR